LVEWLQQRHLLDALASRLRIQRQGGYTGIDLVLFLLYFFVARLPGGLKDFDERAAPYRQPLAGLAHRRKLPARSSISRILRATQPEHSQPLADWLLRDGCGAQSLLQHPSVLTSDALGQPWHLFDLDDTRKVLRQRALPHGPDLPPAQRRAEQAAPGYPGRKRGEVQFSRTTLQHAGSGLWLGLWLAPGNGAWRRHSQAALTTVASVCDSLGHPRPQALVRTDGAGGNVPFLHACHGHGVRYLARYGQYGLLEHDQIRSHLNDARWYAVTDSCSGPSRHATELGWLTLYPGHDTVQDDGSAYPPVRTRLVLSRLPAAADHKSGAGILIDGWQYELFATDLDARAWPAPDVVSTYFARAQENRFAQEDREMGLDRIFSYHLPGQQLASLVGLWVWNLQLVLGLQLCKAPAPVCPRLPRCDGMASEQVVLPLSSRPHAGEGGGTGLSATGEGPAVDGPAAPPRPAQPEPACPPAAGEAESEPLRARSEDEGGAAFESLPDIASFSGSRQAARAVLVAALSRLPWEELLLHPGFRYDARGGLVCPKGELHELQAVTVRGQCASHWLRFVAPYQVCTGCPHRGGCTESAAPLFRKETSLRLEWQPGHELHQWLAKSRGQRLPPRPTPTRPAQAAPQRAVPPKRQAAAGKAARPAAPRQLQNWSATAPPPGPCAIQPAVLQPAKLRKRYVRTCWGIEVSVQLSLPPPKERVEIYALTAQERQHRRKTWAERHQANALPATARVQIEFSGGEALVAVLRRIQRTARREGAA
jgi:hypothetical protein